MLLVANSVWNSGIAVPEHSKYPLKMTRLVSVRVNPLPGTFVRIKGLVEHYRFVQ